jgi:hypothetical protein
VKLPAIETPDAADVTTAAREWAFRLATLPFTATVDDVAMLVQAAMDEARQEGAGGGVKLREDERSALECAGLDISPDEYPALAEAWRGGDELTVTDPAALALELNDLSNAEDAVAEQRGPGWREASRAASALARLMARIRR